MDQIMIKVSKARDKETITSKESTKRRHDMCHLLGDCNNVIDKSVSFVEM